MLTNATVRELKPPVVRASCAATLHDSIGYSDPRGFPVWERTSLNSIDGTQVSGDLGSARITAMITRQKPGTNTTSSPSGHSCCVIERISVA